MATATTATTTSGTQASDGQNRGLPPKELWPRVLKWGGLGIAAIILIAGAKSLYADHKTQEQSRQAEAAVLVCPPANASLQQCRMLVGTVNKIDTSACSTVEFRPIPKPEYAKAEYLPAGLRDVRQNYQRWTGTEDLPAHIDAWRIEPTAGEIPQGYQCLN
ncbi:MAG: hypothetical protein WDN10_01610 [bacterium]